ncbi:MAG: HEAT repeat domain-containing protein, partial [Candidatus Binatia bacterium]
MADDELDVEAFAEALGAGEDGRLLLVLDALQECDRRGPLPEPVLAPLLECLRRPRKAVQRTAAEVLALWSRVTPEIRPRLLERLHDADFHVRWGAAFALAKIGPEPATLGVLLETLGQSDGDMRWAAQGIVVALARRDPAVRDRLGALVATGTPPQRKMAMYCLRDLGEPLPGIRDALIGGLAHDDPEVRLAALSALSHLFAEDAASAVAVLE